MTGQDRIDASSSYIYIIQSSWGEIQQQMMNDIMSNLQI